jgi:hypothetical protein
MEITSRIFLLPVVTLLFLISGTSKAQTQQPHKFSLPPEINCIDADLPITFSWIDFAQPHKKLPAVVLKKIQEIIVTFYLDTRADSTEQFTKSKDVYFNTLRVPYDDLQLFIVILRAPMSYAHCKLFLYDKASKTVPDDIVDYNIWAMYGIDSNGNMKRSSLYKQMQLNKDDIALKKSSNLFLRRIKHNGTSSELEEITLRSNGLSLENISFKSKPLDNK